MKIWVDDIRTPPSEDYVWCRSVNSAMSAIRHFGKWFRVEIIDMDHDAGYYAKYGGDYIKLLDWLEETGQNYPIRIHSMNPVGVENMRRIIRRNRWQEVFDVMVIQSVAAPNVRWHITGSCLTQQEVEFVQNFNPKIYHNDLECYLWAFDTKMSSGRWLENMRFNNALTEAHAYVEPKEEAP